MDETIKKLDKTFLQNALGREPTEAELKDYSELMGRYSVKLNALVKNYTTGVYRGETVAGMAWAEVNHQAEVLSVGADPYLEDDREVLYSSIAAAVNEAVKVNLKAYDEYRNEYSKVLQEVSREVYSLFNIEDPYTTMLNIDPKTLN